MFRGLLRRSLAPLWRRYRLLEEHALSYESQYLWVLRPAGKILTDHLASLRKYPPIPPGAPDPYVPGVGSAGAVGVPPIPEPNELD
jgi:hypothetical protein